MFSVLVLLLVASAVLGDSTPIGLPIKQDGTGGLKEENVGSPNAALFASDMSSSSASSEGPPSDLTIDYNTTTTLTDRRFGTVTIAQAATGTITIVNCVVDSIAVRTSFAGALSLDRMTIREFLSFGSISGNVSISSSVIGTPKVTQNAVYVAGSLDAGSSFMLSHSSLHATYIGLAFNAATTGPVSVSDSTIIVSSTTASIIRAVRFRYDNFGPVSITNSTLECATTRQYTTVTTLEVARARSSFHIRNVSARAAGFLGTVTGVYMRRAQGTACVFLSNVSIAALSLEQSSSGSGTVYGINVYQALGAFAVVDSTINVNTTRTSAAVKISDVVRSAVVFRRVTLSAELGPNSAGRASPNALYIEDNDDGVVVVEDTEISAPSGACIMLPNRGSSPAGVVDLRGVRLSTCRTNVAFSTGTSYVKLNQNCVWLGADTNAAATTTKLGYGPTTAVFPCVGNTPRTTAVEVDSVDAAVGLSECAANAWSMAPVRTPKVTTITGNYTAENEDLGLVRINNPGVVKLVNIQASGIELTGMWEVPSSSSFAATAAVSTTGVVSTTATVSASGPASAPIRDVTIDGAVIGVGGIQFDPTFSTRLLRLTVSNTRLTAVPTTSQPSVQLRQPLLDSTLLFENVTIIPGNVEAFLTQAVTQSIVMFKNVSFTKRYWNGAHSATVSAVVFNDDIKTSALLFDGCRFDLSLPSAAESSGATLIGILVQDRLRESLLHVARTSMALVFVGTSRFLWSKSYLVQSCVTVDSSQFSIRCTDGQSSPSTCKRSATGFSFSRLPSNPTYITLSSLTIDIAAYVVKVIVIDDLRNMDVILNKLTVNVNSRSSNAYFVFVGDYIQNCVLAVTDSSIYLNNGFGIRTPSRPSTYVSILTMNNRWNTRFDVLSPAPKSTMNVRTGCNAGSHTGNLGAYIPCETTPQWAKSQCSISTPVYSALRIDEDRYFAPPTPAPPGAPGGPPGPLEQPGIVNIWLIGPAVFVAFMSVFGCSVIYLLTCGKESGPAGQHALEEQMAGAGWVPQEGNCDNGGIPEVDQVPLMGKQAAPYPPPRSSDFSQL